MTLTLNHTHPSWRGLLKKCLSDVEARYLAQLASQDHWLPGKTAVFNAFSLPLDQTKFILLGESPYPRKQSANGYAFWDGAVGEMFIDPRATFDELKLSKPVNKATSLRNLLKMLLKLSDPKRSKISTLPELFQRLLSHGFLLLNASLVYQDKKSVQQDAKNWQPFMFRLLTEMYHLNPNIELLLFGRIAKLIDPFLNQHNLHYKKTIAEHPYNLSFITNPTVQNFFKPLSLLDSD